MGAPSFQALTFPMPIPTYRSSLKINTKLPSQPFWATISTTTYPLAWLPASLIFSSYWWGFPKFFCYLDDVTLMSQNPTDYERTLNQVFTRLHNHGLVVNRDKRVFGVNSLSFLDFKVSEQGFSPLPTKAINDFPLPHTKRQLKSYLGMYKYYSKFVPNYTKFLLPLHLFPLPPPLPIFSLDRRPQIPLQ